MKQSSYRAFEPVPFSQVTIEDAFWGPRLQINQEKTIPHIYDMCQQTGRLDAYRLDWKPGDEHTPHQFWDSDVAKWIEAASYSLASMPDPELDALLDEVIALIASAQQADGYLNPHYTVVEPDRRWTNLRHGHELYCAGHLIEAAVAHFQATSKSTLLTVACRYADSLVTIFGREPGMKRGYCGHEEIELALIKLYRVTNNPRYLQLSQYFIDERGQTPCYFDTEPAPDYHALGLEYHQAHQPVREQTEVVGHAVRAMYLYSAMVDLFCETGDETLWLACKRLWRHLCSKRMFLTGGIGSSMLNEGFSSDYDLPNDTAYAETCAAIGLVFWCHRMLQVECDAQYADSMERVLYNGVLSSISQNGTTFFYVNPLASQGHLARQPWFDCACCPTNITRLLASFGHYIYSQNERELIVHLYVQGTVRAKIQGQQVVLRQETAYPWNGRVNLTLELGEPAEFALRLRIPGWSSEATLMVNGESFDLDGLSERGYAKIERVWRNADQLTLFFPMPLVRLYASPEIAADIGLVALQRGPLVYCLESIDNAVPLHRLVLPRTSAVQAVDECDGQAGFDGVVTGIANALSVESADWEETTLYRHQPPEMQPATLKAIPYYLWGNRGATTMRVWLREQSI
jgi:uncharacterized protein